MQVIHELEAEVRRGLSVPSHPCPLFPCWVAHKSASVVPPPCTLVGTQQQFERRRTSCTQGGAGDTPGPLVSDGFWISSLDVCVPVLDSRGYTFLNTQRTVRVEQRIDTMFYTSLANTRRAVPNTQRADTCKWRV
jgi:hypothetical protein